MSILAHYKEGLMKKADTLIIVTIIALFISSCVSSSEYKARLADIDNLKQDVSDLETKIQTAEQEKASLEGKLSTAEARIDEISFEREQAIKEKEKAIAGLKNTYDNLVNELNKEISQGQIEITQLKDKLSLTMVEKILFDSGSEMIKEDGKKVLDRVGDILKNIDDKQITIEGHTDNIPISTRLQQKFPTNWELSTSRAATVVRYLQEKAGIDPQLLIAAGVAEYRPVDSNETKEGRAKNRRIEIILAPLEYERSGPQVIEP